MASEQPRRNIANPWPRLLLATGLTVWAGSNLWSAIFRWNEIMVADIHNRYIGVILSILFVLAPLVVAIFLLWTVVVGPNDPRFNRPAKNKTDAKKQTKPGKSG